MEATRRNLIDILTAWEFFCNLNRNVTGKYTFITQLTKVIVTDREDAFTVRILRSAQEVTWTTSEGHIENVEFLLFEEFKLQEIREVFTEWTDFSTKSKLSELVLTLYEYLILISYQRWVPWTGTELGDLVEDQIIAQ